MSTNEDIGERFREASCVGDIDLVSKLVSQGADVNSQNPMNGWTALHWACKRNHVKVASFLKEQGADNSVLNKDGHAAAQLSTNEDIQQLFGVAPGMDVKISKLPITPNYLANPSFPYASSPDKISTKSTVNNVHSKGYGEPIHQASFQNGDSLHELVLKARIANCEEKDFIEVEMVRSSLSFTNLLNLMCAELGVDKKTVAKVRKLPDTIVRKDKDVFRLRDFQEMELVLTNRAMSAASRTYNITPAKNNETILY